MRLFISETLDRGIMCIQAWISIMVRKSEGYPDIQPSRYPDIWMAGRSGSKKVWQGILNDGAPVIVRHGFARLERAPLKPINLKPFFKLLAFRFNHKMNKRSNMKTPEEMYEETYKGFTATSVVNANYKGFLLGYNTAAEEYKDHVLEIVDACFHAYASDYRNKAKALAEKILNT